ncbi:MAG: hypothetical protein GXP62_19655 [Oligoflexia bacterium]|nr:hypothetical protein [Oligoflexia bacterium]
MTIRTITARWKDLLLVAIGIVLLIQAFILVRQESLVVKATIMSAPGSAMMSQGGGSVPTAIGSIRDGQNPRIEQVIKQVELSSEDAAIVRELMASEVTRIEAIKARQRSGEVDEEGARTLTEAERTRRAGLLRERLGDDLGAKTEEAIVQVWEGQFSSGSASR